MIAASRRLQRPVAQRAALRVRCAALRQGRSVVRGPWSVVRGLWSVADGWQPGRQPGRGRLLSPEQPIRARRPMLAVSRWCVQAVNGGVWCVVGVVGLLSTGRCWTDATSYWTAVVQLTWTPEPPT